MDNHIKITMLALLFGTIVLVNCGDKNSDRRQETTEIENKYNQKPTRNDGGISNKSSKQIVKDSVKDTITGGSVSQKKNAQK